MIGTSRGGGAGRRFPGPATEGIIAGSVCPVAVAPRGYARQAVAATREVLVAFDGSHEATAALAHAAALAAEASARLSVINVVRSPSRSSVSLVGSALAEVGATAAVEIAGGDPASEIVARTARVDLLVMGSRGRGAIRRPALGTVVSQVVRDAASPVLVLPQSAVLEGAGRAFETTAGTR